MGSGFDACMAWGVGNFDFCLITWDGPPGGSAGLRGLGPHQN